MKKLKKKACLLDDILQPGALTTLFQPIVELTPGGEVVHALECLSRGPRGTNVEESNLLFDYARYKCEECRVDRACINTALRSAAGLGVFFEKKPSPLLALNVHASTLTGDGSFPEFLVAAAEEHGFLPSDLVLEIVEHSPATSLRSLRIAISVLREYGVQVALDDVGRGYSSYQMILECQPKYYKVDRCLVTDNHKKDVRLALLESILFLARRLGARVVAEGVETASELSLLYSLGIDLVQGHYYAPALSAATLEKHPVFGRAAPRPRTLSVAESMHLSA